MPSRNNRFDVQASQTDKVLFCLGARRLSAENGERASLKSMTKNRHPKILNRKKRSIKKQNSSRKQKKKKKKKKKLPASSDKRHDTRVCISMNQSVGSVEAIHNEGMGA